MSKFLKCPIEHVQVAMNPADAVTGCILNYNIGALPAIVKVSAYMVTTPTTTSDHVDIGHHQTTKTRSDTFANGVAITSGGIIGPGFTVATNILLCAANDYITAYNLATDTATIATGIVGYFDLEIIRFPVRVGDQ